MTGEQYLTLTPTARLARAHRQALASSRVADGQSAWQSEPVLSFSAWMAQLRDDWLLVTDDHRVPMSGGQALQLWHEVIDHDIFIGEPRVAELAAASWRLLHEYCLEQPQQWNELWLNEDSRRFRDWAERFTALCDQRGLIDEWRLAALLPTVIEQGQLHLPARIELLGFDLPPTPLQESLFRALEAAGTRLERVRANAASGDTASPVITVCADADSELEQAAGWARQWIEQHPEDRIAVVVPDLGDRRTRVERIFRSVFDPPGQALEPASSEPWHVSLGPPLADWPLPSQALDILRLDPWRFSQQQAAGLLRSPYLSQAIEEQFERCRAVGRLASHAPWWITALQLREAVQHCGARHLLARLHEWELVRREHRDPALPSAWVERFQTELAALGFGHGRGLDSQEFQVLQRWHELLEDFSSLDLVSPHPVSRAEAVRLLARQAGAQAFRERNPGTPVEVLGVEEALGSRFDAIWLCSLDHETWPRPARRDPLVPAPVQQVVPAASVEGQLQRCRLELEGLMRAASVVHGSHVERDGEARLVLTPLIDKCQLQPADPAPLPDPVALDIVPEDIHAPATTGAEQPGGTGALQAQSDCPFKAFARSRLHARDLCPPRPGLDARSRGNLMHWALEHFWSELDGHAALIALDREALDERIDRACQVALEKFIRHNPLTLGKKASELQKRCLADTLGRWLDLEKARDPFTVAEREWHARLQFGELELTGKIDRIDEIEGGGRIVIDYKTGAVGKSGWAPDRRLANVQLPAYALSLDERPIALAFASLRPDRLGFDGLAEVDIGTPGVAVIGQMGKRSAFSQCADWPGLMDQWREQLQALADEFLSGHSAVTPRDKQVCRFCHLHGLCRIHERSRRMEAEDD